MRLHTFFLDVHRAFLVTGLFGVRERVTKAEVDEYIQCAVQIPDYVRSQEILSVRIVG